MNTYAILASKPPDTYKPIIRELMAYEALDPYCNPLHRDKFDRFYPDYPHVLHWSRQVEWPWSIVETNLEPHHDCLEVGGAGTPLKYLIAKLCRSLTSTEIDPKAIPQIQEQINNQGFKNIHQVEADVRNLPFPDNSFDRVFCISVVEHIEKDRDKAIKELIRVLKSKGVLILTMDVALTNAGKGNNFYVDEMGCLQLLNLLGIDKVYRGDDPPLICYFKEEDVNLSVVLVRYEKP